MAYAYAWALLADLHSLYISGWVGSEGVDFFDRGFEQVREYAARAGTDTPWWSARSPASCADRLRAPALTVSEIGPKGAVVPGSATGDCGSAVGARRSSGKDRCGRRIDRSVDAICRPSSGSRNAEGYGLDSVRSL